MWCRISSSKNCARDRTATSSSISTHFESRRIPRTGGWMGEGLHRSARGRSTCPRRGRPPLRALLSQSCRPYGTHSSDSLGEVWAINCGMHLQWWRSVFYAVVCTVKLTQEMSRRRQHEDASLWLWRQRDDFELFETSSILLFGVLPGSTALIRLYMTGTAERAQPRSRASSLPQ